MFTTWNKTLKLNLNESTRRTGTLTFVGSLKSGRSRNRTADKPRPIQITKPSNKKHHEYFTTKVEYLCNTNT